MEVKRTGVFEVHMLCLIGVLIACSGGIPDGSEAAREALRVADASLTAAVAAKDLDRTASFYADDAHLLPAAKPMVMGRDRIREEWHNIFSIPGFSNESELRKIEVARSADLGYTQGTYETTLISEDGDAMIERGKWLTVWRKLDDGTWKIVAEMYNTDTPPPDHK